MSVLVRLVQGYSFSSFERKNSAPRYLAHFLLHVHVLLEQFLTVFIAGFRCS